MTKNKIILFLFLLISLLLTSCYSFNINIEIEEDGSNIVDMSFTLMEEEISSLTSSVLKEDTLDSVKEKVDNAFVKEGFKKEDSKELTYSRTEKFGSYNELKDFLNGLKLEEHRIFRNVELEDRENSIFFYMAMNDIIMRESRLFTQNPTATLSLNMPYDISISNGGVVNGNKIKYNLLTNDIFYAVSNRPEYILGTINVNIFIESEDNGYIEWIIEEKIGEEDYNNEITSSALSWGFKEKESNKDNFMNFNKIMPFNNYEEMRDILLKITLKGDPENDELIFADVDITQEENNLIFTSITNRHYHKDVIVINIIMPYDIVESKGGYLFNSNALTCSINKLNNNEIVAKTVIPDESIPATSIAIIWGLSIIVLLIIIALIISLIENKIEKKKDKNKKENKETNFPEIDILSEIENK